METPQASSGPVAPRKRSVALLLTFLAPGLGQIYSGGLKKGLLFYGLFWAFHVISFFLVLTIPRAPLNIVTPIALWLAMFLYIARDAVIIAKKNRVDYRLKAFNRWYVYLMFIFVGTLIINPIIKYTLVHAYHMSAGSMESTLEIGDYILANKLSYGIRDPRTRDCLAFCASPKRGDVIVFIFPEDRTKDFVKRVVGVAGDTVEIRNRKLYIDEKAVEEPYAQFSAESADQKLPLVDDYGPQRVPENRVFVLGDLRDKSYDSRFWGFVDVADVKGKAVVIYWSWDADARIIRLERIGKAIE
ncbi:MAG TPA: signal peptidase I [Candidatus Binatia bacterium]|nr:signal peptidase I [Candidatus Binatia bacterium]